MRKRIAISVDAVTIGGVEEVLVQMLRNFDYDTYQVDLYGCCIPQYRDRIPSCVNIHTPPTLSHLEIIKHLCRKGCFLSVLSYFAHYAACFSYYRRGMRGPQFYHSVLNYRHRPLLSDTEYDAIIAYTCLQASSVGNALFCLKGSKRILWTHGAIDHGKKYNSKVDLRIYKEFNINFCVSQAIQEDFRKHFPISGMQSNVLYNLIDVDRIRTLSLEPISIQMKHPSLVTVGRLSPEKGQDVIPEIVRMLLDAGHPVYWYLIGDGPLRNHIESEILRLNIENYVILLGAKLNPFPYIKGCDIYVQTSHTEGWCLTTQEARVLCKPIVTTDIPVMHEQFTNEQNGLIVKDCPHAIGEGILSLLTNSDLCNRLAAANARETNDNKSEIVKLYQVIEPKSGTGDSL